MKNVAQLLRRHRDWYETELNTANLVQTIISEKQVAALSEHDIWNLIRLTWITRSDEHWQILKAPALAQLWNRQTPRTHDLGEAIAAMSLPGGVAHAAMRSTGFVNFRNQWRNSSRNWCKSNRRTLIGIIADAVGLQPNDLHRIRLASKIDNLPPVPPPPGTAGGHAAPFILLTPLIACLDPHRRFPVINGREAVRDLLGGLDLRSRSFSEQVAGMVGLVGKFGIEDSFVLDVVAGDIVDVVKKVPRLTPAPSQLPGKVEVGDGSDLPDFDVEERKALQKSQTIQYRNRHNEMTNGLKRLCSGWRKLKRETNPDCCYDVLIEDYNLTGRDLLIEAKPDPDRGSLRVAIGQLFDYSRFLPHKAGTDLAVLTISQPLKSYRQLLLDLQISPIWFTDEACESLEGEGKAWDSLKSSLVLCRRSPGRNS
jgi:hypothetical protein